MGVVDWLGFSRSLSTSASRAIFFFERQPLQKTYFNWNCIIRGPPPVAPRKAFAALVVIFPNVAGLLRAWPGLLNLTEFVTLNASARISTRRSSPIENSLERA